MRNWNSTIQVAKVSKCSVLIVPMRNWNSCTRTGRIWRRNRVLIVPMRNWNSTVKVLLLGSLTVLIVPMRNWNSLCGISSSWIGMFWSYLWGIETEAFNSFTKKHGSCFDRTYEELKQQINPPPSHTARRFWSYLWGIETDKGNKPPAGNIKFWSYLWGIETFLQWTNQPRDC